MEKLKEHKEIVIIVLAAILGAFYWIQIRPVTAKKECSWFNEVIPASAGITKEQAEINKIAFDQCIIDNPGGRLYPISFKCFQLQEDTKEKLPQPEKEITREA